MQLRAGVAAGRSGSRRGSRPSACRSSARTPAPSRRRRPSMRRTASACSGRSTSTSGCRRSTRGPSGSSSRVAVLLQRQEVRPVAVDLVRRGEDERRVRACSAALASSRFSVPLALTREVGLRVARRPVVRRLRGACGRRARGRRRARRTTRIDRRRRRGCRGRASGTCRSRATSCRVVRAVDASGPKNCARMSFSMPTTSKPCSTRCSTDSEPIRPPDPVTMAIGHARGSERLAQDALVVDDPLVRVGEDLRAPAARAPRCHAREPRAVREVDGHVARALPRVDCSDVDPSARDLGAQRGRLQQRQADRARRRRR